jgi:azurin
MFLVSGSVLIMKKALLIVGVMFCPLVYAVDCEITVETTSMTAFKVSEISVNKSCIDVKINFTNLAAMKHSLVITKTSDMPNVIKDGISSGPAKAYLRDSDERIVASSPLISRGQTASMTMKMSGIDTNESYSYFCSFPGHAYTMKGILKFE